MIVTAREHTISIFHTIPPWHTYKYIFSLPRYLWHTIISLSLSFLYTKTEWTADTTSSLPSHLDTHSLSFSFLSLYLTLLLSLSLSHLHLCIEIHSRLTGRQTHPFPLSLSLLLLHAHASQPVIYYSLLHLPPFPAQIRPDKYTYYCIILTCPYTRYCHASVTRFGEILPLWRHFISLWQFLNV